MTLSKLIEQLESATQNKSGMFELGEDTMCAVMALALRERAEPKIYAELHRLREEVRGPDGFATWKDAAIAERKARVECELRLNQRSRDIDYLTAAAAFHSDDWHKMGPITAYMHGWNARNACRTAMLAQPTKANNVIGQYQAADGLPNDIVTLGRTASRQSELLSSGPQMPVAWISDSGKSLILDSEIEPCFKFNGWKPLGYQSSAEPGKDEPVSNPYKLPEGWIKCSERMPDSESEQRVCAYTPSPHEDMRYRFVPASLFKTVCRSATHWYYMEPPVGVEDEV